LLSYWVTPSDEVIEYLITMRATLQDVVRSAGPFLVAVGQLLYLTAWPLVMGLYLLLSKASRGFYEYVIVRFVASPTTIRHVRYGISTAIAWQMARTKREIAMEVAGVASLISLYLLLRFLNRQRYLDRFKAYVRRQRRMLQMVRVDIINVQRDFVVVLPMLLLRLEISRLFGEVAHSCFSVASCGFAPTTKPQTHDTTVLPSLFRSNPIDPQTNSATKPFYKT
jgi:hypothetical protein